MTGDGLVTLQWHEPSKVDDANLIMEHVVSGFSWNAVNRGSHALGMFLQELCVPKALMEKGFPFLDVIPSSVSKKPDQFLTLSRIVDSQRPSICYQARSTPTSLFFCISLWLSNHQIINILRFDVDWNPVLTVLKSTSHSKIGLGSASSSSTAPVIEASTLSSAASQLTSLSSTLFPDVKQLPDVMNQLSTPVSLLHGDDSSLPSSSSSSLSASYQLRHRHPHVRSDPHLSACIGTVDSFDGNTSITTDTVSIAK
jgi:hypothetical protein